MVSEFDLNLPKQTNFLAPAMLYKRLLAFIVDIVLLFSIILAPFGKAITTIIPNIDNMSYSALNALMMNNNYYSYKISLLVFLASLITLSYFVLMDNKFGQTVGKMIFNIYVIKTPSVKEMVEAKKSGKQVKQYTVNGKMDFKTAIIRNISVVPMFPFVILMLVDPITIFTDKNNRRFLEKLSGTMTVEMMSLNGGL